MVENQVFAFDILFSFESCSFVNLISMLNSKIAC